MKRQTDPRMHSVEHILNQTMVRMYGCGRCFAAHIEKKKSKCDYHFDHPLTDKEISDIQSRVNQVIDSDLPVTESFVSKDSVDKLYNTEKLPRDVDGTLRIINIGDYDACPCIGKHVSSTGKLAHSESRPQIMRTAYCVSGSNCHVHQLPENEVIIILDIWLLNNI